MVGSDCRRWRGWLAGLGLALGACNQAAPVTPGTATETSSTGVGLTTEATDTEAADGTTATPEPGPDLDVLFDPDVVQDFELVIDPIDRQQMFDALPELVYVPATFRWRDITVEQVGVRFKGNSSSSPDQPFKRSYLIKFNEFVSGQRFLDLRRLSLDNGIQFGSLFSERLVTDTLRARGAIASRSNYARLTVNDEYQGVYVNVERIDKSFLEHHFADPHGPLYKVHEGGPGAALEYLGSDPAAYAQTFENKGDDVWDGDLQPIVELVGSLDQVSPGEASDWLQQTWEAEGLLESLPVLLLAGAFDQYTGWNAHNYYLYRDPSTQRWTYIPWDLDVGFADDAFGQIPVLSGWNAAYPYPVAPRPLLDRLVSDPMLLADYRSRAQEVLEAHFHPDVIVPALYQLHALIEADLAEDPFPDVRVTNPEDTGYDGILASLSAFMEARYAAASDELANPVDTPPVDPGGGPPPPGDPSPEDPTDLLVVAIDAAGVHLQWTDNSPDEGGFVLQRCAGAACSDFTAHMAVPTDSTTVTDPAVRSGQTYRYRVYAVVPAMPPVATGPSNVVDAVVP